MPVRPLADVFAFFCKNHDKSDRSIIQPLQGCEVNRGLIPPVSPAVIHIEALRASPSQRELNDPPAGGSNTPVPPIVGQAANWRK